VSEEKFQTWAQQRDADQARIAELEDALRRIAKMKSEPIGDTGFAVGPLALFQASQRIAREALRKQKQLS